MVGDRRARNGDGGGADAAARRWVVGGVPDAARKVAVKSRDVREKFAQPGGVNVLLRGAGVQDDGNGVHHTPLAGEGVGVDPDEIRHGVRVADDVEVEGAGAWIVKGSCGGVCAGPGGLKG